MKTKKMIIFFIVAIPLLLHIIPLKAQVKWSVKLIQSGMYQVIILPEDTINSVSFKASLISNSKTITVERNFTNSNYPELFPGFTYYKRYYCDNTITKVIGDILTCLPSVDLPTGARALTMIIEA